MATHPLDHGNPIWPDPVEGKHSNITDEVKDILLAKIVNSLPKTTTINNVKFIDYK